MNTRRTLVATALAAAMLLLAGCTPASPGDGPVTAKATDRSLAAATIAILGTQPRFSAPATSLYNFPAGSIGTDVHLTVDGTKLIVTTVASPTRPKDAAVNCADPDGAYDGCTVRTVKGHRLVTWWQLNQPEEDPGILVFDSVRGAEYVEVDFVGPAIRSNPLKGGIPIAASKLEAIATSAAVGLKTTKGYADAGAKLAHWRAAN